MPWVWLEVVFEIFARRCFTESAVSSAISHSAVVAARADSASRIRGTVFPEPELEEELELDEEEEELLEDDEELLLEEELLDDEEELELDEELLEEEEEELELPA